MKLSSAAFNDLLKTLESRFGKFKNRHKGILWSQLQARLETFYSGSKSDTHIIWCLSEMERTGGEPDVIGYDKKTGEYIFCDCSPESPSGRRSVCYDREGLDSRKEHRPENNAIDMAAAMGIELLDEEQYRNLQQFGPFDTKTSSWLKTPDPIRKQGGAIFGDYRYGQVFVYHNGAQSYYAARGFRGLIRV